MGTSEKKERRRLAAEARRRKREEDKEGHRLRSEAREMGRLEKEKARPKGKGYLWYLIFFLCLVYIVDEVATGLHNGIVNEAVSSFFITSSDPRLASEETSNGLGTFSTMEMVANILLVIGFFYKALADRFGRKPFLIANTIGMVGGLLLCLWGPNLAVYILGFCVIRFFVTPDEQIVYIFESAPKEKRGSIYSGVKGVAELGLLLIPLGRYLFIDSLGNGWRMVFLIPACIGAAVSFFLCFFARETDPFIESRLRFLKLSPAERLAIAKEKKDQSRKQGGFFAAVRYGWGGKQLRWIFIVTILFTLSRWITSEYSPILDAAGFTGAQTTNALFMYPITAALIVFAYGFLSDKVGRKITSITLLAITIVSLSLFVLGAYLRWNEFALGLLIGLFLGAYWSNGDTLILMTGESAPTNLRASIMSAQTMFYGIGMVVSQGLGSIALKVFKMPASYIGLFSICLAIPCFVLSLVFLMGKVKETKGADVDKAVTQE
ncbi:MAG: MFS transporter [Bacilli bacterium]|jgi:MFS family permease|nr:MFS transporter [Bacilli bacterium]